METSCFTLSELVCETQKQIGGKMLPEKGSAKSGPYEFVCVCVCVCVFS